MKCEKNVAQKHKIEVLISITCLLVPFYYIIIKTISTWDFMVLLPPQKLNDREKILQKSSSASSDLQHL